MKKKLLSWFLTLIVCSMVVYAVPIPVSVYLNVLDNGGGVDTSKKLTVYYTGQDGDGNPIPLSINTVDNMGQEILQWGPFGGDPAVFFATIEIKPVTDVVIHVQGYENYTFPSVSGNIDDGQGGPLDITLTKADQCQDSDGDGYNGYDAIKCPTGNDCNDGDNSIHPGATEVCNNKDDDCNGGTVDGSQESWYGDPCDGIDTDLCQEGSYSCISGSQSCSDNTASTVDICNGLDDDCDSASSDGSEDPLNGQACDGADSDLCKEGTTSCSAGALVCSDNTASTVDICNGLDDDCDASSSDGSEDPLNGQSCDGADSDLCKEGTTSCSAGALVCSDNTGSTVEVCEGSIDEDCDGSVDEGCNCTTGQIRNCPKQSGVCSGSKETCNAQGQWPGCDYSNIPYYESTEASCDNKDNDCDGTVDESLTRPTTCGVGACAGNAGYETCTAGVWENDNCDPYEGSTSETCNNIDDDCDGTKDESLTRPTTCGVGACAGNTGIETCTSGTWGGNTCDPFADATAEKCNSIDDDCDGSTDETFTDLGNACSVGVGECLRTGTRVCKVDGAGTQCSATAGTPSTEICDNKDNDCDSSIDESLTKSCGTGVCAGTQTCTSGNWGDCSTKNNDGGICAICNSAGTSIYDATQDSDCTATSCPDSCTIDANSFTWDYADDVPNECSGLYTCTQNQCSYNHICRDNDQYDGLNGNKCGAECDQNSDCNDDNPSTIDTCGIDCTCKHIKEICNNSQDDDNDGKIDCADTDCVGEIGPNQKICCQTASTCDNEQYCDGSETCSNNECQAGTPVSCLAYNLPGIATCNNNPDTNPFTWDYREAFTSVCDENANACTTGDDTITHTLDTEKCGAQCEQDSDCTCPANTCIDSNGDALIDDYLDYPEQGNCQDGTCTGCQPTTKEHSTNCITAMKIPIEEGVSMFSLPLVPEEPVTFNNIQEGCIFSSYVKDGKGIAYWDPLKAGTDKYEYLDANTILHPGQGYFTTQSNECEFIITGYKFTADILGRLGTDNIYTGWNMIGAPSETVNNFDLIENTCAVTSGPWGFDAAKYQYVRTQKLEPGKGYFIKTTNNCNLG